MARAKTGENGAQEAACSALLAHLDACGSGSNLVSARVWTVVGGSRPQVVRRRPLGPQLRDRFAKTGVVAQNLTLGSKNRFAERLVGLAPANGRCEGTAGTLVMRNDTGFAPSGCLEGF